MRPPVPSSPSASSSPTGCHLAARAAASLRGPARRREARESGAAPVSLGRCRAQCVVAPDVALS
eukprot:4381025-Pyramimonas_sp.AAC.1